MPRIKTPTALLLILQCSFVRGLAPAWHRYSPFSRPPPAVAAAVDGGTTPISAAPTVTVSSVPLPTGLDMEVFFSEASSSTGQQSRRPPLVFIHGSFHGGWCWAEHWLPFFAALGHPSYAVSLRGTSGSIAAEPRPTVAVEEHVKDLTAFLQAKGMMAKEGKGDNKKEQQQEEEEEEEAEAGEEEEEEKNDVTRPVLVAHSFGGVALMKLLQASPPEALAGAAFLCSVPPSGNGPMTQRFLTARPVASLKIVLGFVAKRACASERLCRELFFGDTLGGDGGSDGNGGDSEDDDNEGGEDDKEQLRKYMARFTADSKVGLDLRALASSLPILDAGPDGVATWRRRTTPRTTTTAKGREREGEEGDRDRGGRSTFHDTAIMVLGAEDDYLVDEAGVRETALFLVGATQRRVVARGDSDSDDSDEAYDEAEGGLDSEPSSCPRQWPGYTWLSGTPHDVMLGKRWRLAAGEVAGWAAGLL